MERSPAVVAGRQNAWEVPALRRARQSGEGEAVMRECPNCGFTETFNWKNSPHQLYMQYLNPDEAQEFLKENTNLAAALQVNSKYAENGFYAFRITRSGHLHRQPKTHCVNGKWTNYSSCYENAKKAKEKRNQRRLFEEEVKQ
jgi:hypothetical protein